MSFRRTVLILLSIMLTVMFSGCVKKPSVKNTVEGNMKTYYEMTDETWMCDDRIYKYRLEISGRIPNAAVDSSYIYLSNIEEITFEEAYKASGISSYSGDYFSPEKAVMVEMR